MNSNDEVLASLNRMVKFLKKDLKHNDIRHWEYIKNTDSNKAIKIALTLEKPTGFSNIVFFIPIHFNDIVLRRKKIQLEDHRDEKNIKYYTLLGVIGTLKIKNNIMKAIHFLENVANHREVEKFFGRGENG